MYGFAARLAYKKEYFTGICVNNHPPAGGGCEVSSTAGNNIGKARKCYFLLFLDEKKQKSSDCTELC
jgi:hypothetical protein